MSQVDTQTAGKKNEIPDRSYNVSHHSEIVAYTSCFMGPKECLLMVRKCRGGKYVVVEKGRNGDWVVVEKGVVERRDVVRNTLASIFYHQSARVGPREVDLSAALCSQIREINVTVCSRLMSIVERNIKSVFELLGVIVT